MYMLCHILNTTFRWLHEVNHLLGNQSAFIEYLSWENTEISWVITWDLMIYNTHHKEGRNDSAKYLVARWYVPPYLEVSNGQYIKIFVSSLCSIYSKGLNMTLLKISVYIYLWSLFTVRNVNIFLPTFHLLCDHLLRGKEPSWNQTTRLLSWSMTTPMQVAKILRAPASSSESYGNDCNFFSFEGKVNY